MTTSYKIDAVKKLKNEKAISRVQEMQDNAKAVMQAQAKKEASDARIAAKQAIIDAGGVVPNPTPVVQDEPVVEKKAKPKKVAKAAPKKAAAKKPAAKNRGRPAGSKNKK